MLTISPMGESGTSLVANAVDLLVTMDEQLVRPYPIKSSIAPVYTVQYTYGTPRLVETTVFVPIYVTISITTPNCKDLTVTKLYRESFMTAFNGQTELPSIITIDSNGQYSTYEKVICCKAKNFVISDSLRISIA